MPSCRICGKEYNITGALRVIDDDTKEPVGFIPVVDIPQVSDYEWQLGALKSRLIELRCPKEDTKATLKKLKKWVIENTTDELYKRYKAKYSICYDYIYEAGEGASKPMNEHITN